MIEPPRFVRTTAVPTAFIHVTVPRAEIQRVMGPGLGELMAALARQKVAPAGPWLCHHLKTDARAFDFRLSVPVAGPVKAAGRVEAGQLPAAMVARTVHHGPFEGLSGSWQALHAWIARQGQRPGPSFWEVYLVGPEASADPAAWRTELNRPVMD